MWSEISNEQDQRRQTALIYRYYGEASTLPIKLNKRHCFIILEY